METQQAGALNVASGVQICRAKKGLSARALSAQAGLSNGYVTKLESGQIEPSVRAFGSIVRVLEMGPMEVFACVVGEAVAPT